MSKDDIRAGATSVGVNDQVERAFYKLLHEAVKRAAELKARVPGPGEVSALDEAALLYDRAISDAVRGMIARKAAGL